MVQNLPNLATVTGYTNASWTLKADLVCAYTCRLLKYMDMKGYKTCTPRLDAKDAANIKTSPMIDFASGYIQRGADIMPRQGDKSPWKLHQNYVKDMITLRHRRIDDENLEFE